MADHRRDGFYDNDTAPGLWEGFLDVVDGLGKVLAVIVIVAALFVGAHVVPALTSYSNPPASCQIFGGQWSIWGGWHCG